MAPKSRFFSASFRAPRALQGAVVALGLYILVVNLSGIGLVLGTIDANERNVTEFLSLLGRQATTPTRDYFYFLEFVSDPATGELEEDSLAEYQSLPQWRDMATSLAAVAAEPIVARVHLLTPSGDVIMDAKGQVAAEFAQGEFATGDKTLITVAAGGVAAASTAYRRDLRKRIYFPIRNEANRVVAILRVEGNSSTSSSLVTLRNRLLLALPISTGICVLLWYFTVRLVRRTIEAERSASQADRLRALGTMTAGIAHEVRNPLAIITLQLEEMRAIAKTLSDVPQREALNQLHQELKEETTRLRGLTEQFLGFSKASSRPELKVVAFRAAPSVEATVKLWGKGTDPVLREVSFCNDAGELKVFFEEPRLRQILLNLLRNADEALGKTKGHITVGIERRGAMMDVSVRDSGPGIDPANLEQIFDPFFTTRAEGTGLGLSVSRALAESAGGSLTATSTKGQGATFLLKLRIAE